MREIKFRAWDGEHILLPFYSLEDLAYRSLLFENKNLIWMRYTGLKDKNGKEIYEGDIVEHINLNCDKEIMLPTKSIIQFGIEYVDTSSYEENMTEINGFYLEPIDCLNDYEKIHYMSAFSDGSRLEVIGNIHENTELLK